ncbi:MAG: heavy-metal-associated domain-containing protein [Williamsia sp.]|nr:heavy-metal-associated domain-containing protein [Williamsia sp.]
MKKWFLNFMLLLATGNPLFAQDAKLRIRDFTPRFTIKEFHVSGVCGQCTRRILNALNVTGVKSAYWDKEEQRLVIQYEEKKIGLVQVHTLIAAAGHDTETVKAPDEAYAKLPSCCHYRKTN